MSTNAPLTLHQLPSSLVTVYRKLETVDLHSFQYFRFVVVLFTVGRWRYNLLIWYFYKGSMYQGVNACNLVFQ